MVADMDAEKPFGERKENSYGRVMDYHNSLQKHNAEGGPCDPTPWTDRLADNSISC